MGRRKNCLQYVVQSIMLLLLPTILWAECAEWLLCPYRSRVEQPNKRYVSLDDARLSFEWKEIEVEGNQALVCLSEVAPANITVTTSCTPTPRPLVRNLLISPYQPYFDGESIKFRGTKRPFDVRMIKRRINDSALDELR
jgi:hypothetical protein